MTMRNGKSFWPYLGLVAVNLALTVIVLLRLGSQPFSSTAMEWVHRVPAPGPTPSPAFPAASWAKGFHWVAPVDQHNPFYTTYFQPPPPPPPKPAPKTKKIELTYQGFFQTEDGTPQAFVKVGNQLVVGSLGTAVVNDFKIAAIRADSLTLTNAAKKTDKIQFDRSQSMEIPVR